MRKNIFVSIKIIPILTFMLVVILSFVITLGLYSVAEADTVVKFNYTIVIDSGHGGLDVK